MRNQIRAEFFKLKYSGMLKTVLILFCLGFVLYMIFGISQGGTQIFVSEGDEEIDQTIQGMVGFLAFTFENTAMPHFSEIVKSAMSCNVFLWIIMLVFVISFFNYDYNMGTIKLPIAYGISRNKIFLAKLIVITVYFGILYLLFSIFTLLYTCIKVSYFPKVNEIFLFFEYTILNYMVMVTFAMLCVLASICLKNTGIIAVVMCLFTLIGGIVYTGIWQQFHSMLLLRYLVRLTPLYYLMNMGALRLEYGIIYEIIIYFCFGMVLLPISAFLVNKQEIK